MLTRHRCVTAGSLIAVIGSLALGLVWFGARHSRTLAGAAKPGPAQRAEELSRAHEQKLLADALRRKPGHAPVLFRLAQMAEEAGRTSDAAKHLRELLESDPDNTDARLELGKVLFESGDVRDAVDQNERILKTQPAHPDALYNLGAVYANLGDYARARSYWLRVIAAQPQSASAERAKQMLARLDRSRSGVVN